MSKVHRKILDIHDDYLSIGKAIYDVSFDVIGEYDIEDSNDQSVWKEEEKIITDILNAANIDKPEMYRPFHIASYDSDGKYIGCERNMIWGKDCCGLDCAEHDIVVECDVANRNPKNHTLWMWLREWSESFGDDIERTIIEEFYKLADSIDYNLKYSSEGGTGNEQ